MMIEQKEGGKFMVKTSHWNTLGGKRILPGAAIRGMAWGAGGGLVATLVMDLVLMGVLSALHMPALACFSIIGETMAGLFSRLGMEISGGVPAGVAAHYILGPLIGAIFGAAAAQIRAINTGGKMKITAFAVLFVEILSQPILALTPLIVNMTDVETAQWFGGSFVMHLFWGVVLGAVVSRGLERGESGGSIRPSSPGV